MFKILLFYCFLFLTVPGVGLTPTEAPSKDHLNKALVLAKKSTASIGKFTDNLPKEKPSKHTGKKRKVGYIEIISKVFRQSKPHKHREKFSVDSEGYP